MNTQLRTLPLKYCNPSSRIEITEDRMDHYPDDELRITLARAIGRIGYWFRDKEFDGNIFPHVVKDPEVRGGELRVGLAGMDRRPLKILLYTNDNHASRFDPPHSGKLPYVTNSDAIVRVNVAEMAYIYPANGWYRRTSNLATTADLIVGHNFLASAVGTPQIPITPEAHTRSLARLCLTNDTPEEIPPFFSGL